MKNLLTTLVVAFLTVSLATSCAKEEVALPSKDSTSSQIKKYERAIAVELLALAKDKDFRTLVLEECLKQEHGDYNVYLRNLVNTPSDNKEVGAGLTKLKPLVTQLRALYGGNEPILSLPKSGDV